MQNEKALQEPLNEALLGAWLTLSAVLRNERFVERLSFNEAFLCGILERQRVAYPQAPYLPIRDLCRETRMLKSQLNKVITDMEEKGLVQRRRLSGDRRLVYVELTEAGQAQYGREHARILEIVDRVIKQLGTEEAENTIACLYGIIRAVDTLMDNQGG